MSAVEVLRRPSSRRGRGVARRAVSVAEAAALALAAVVGLLVVAAASVVLGLWVALLTVAGDVRPLVGVAAVVGLVVGVWLASTSRRSRW